MAGFSSARNYFFTDNGDGTIKDHRTGLTWEKCSYGQSGNACTGGVITNNWTGNLNRCNTLVLASKTWRLPSMNELAGFFDFFTPGANPRVDSTYFPNTPAGNSYYASTTDTSNDANKTMFNTNGNPISFDGTTNVTSRCVAD